MHCPCSYPSVSPAVNSSRTLQPRGQGQAGQCQQLLRPEDEPAHGQHAVLACQTRPRGDTRNFLQIWGLLSADASCFMLHLQLGSLVSQRLWCHYHCWDWSRTMVSIEAPRLWLYPVRPCSHWEGGWRNCHSHPSAASLKGSTQSGSRDASGTGAASTALPTPRKRKCGLPLTSVCLLSARDSHHCHVQGTLCSRVV